ncbi:hypothetical protein MASSI9I_20671 [Massilia sp. 9I]|nr:hypothetical protein MASSI9I_20671 [Massilia sp. 9I]
MSFCTVGGAHQAEGLVAPPTDVLKGYYVPPPRNRPQKA